MNKIARLRFNTAVGLFSFLELGICPIVILIRQKIGGFQKWNGLME
jgi:hypothetical protein